MDNKIMYSSVRQEILDQKKCQFQMVGVSLTFSAGALAVSGVKDVLPVFYLAPIVMNILTMNIILDKATSIQRMVGYLQLMEAEKSEKPFQWERHLNKFREIEGQDRGKESWRKHKYITYISLILLLLSMMSAIIFVIRFTGFDLLSIVILLFIAGLLFFGIYIFVYRWRQLVFGRFTSKAVKAQWELAIDLCKKEDSEREGENLPVVMG